jgi:nucleotide-binding universal stress UspA family protein
MKIVFAADGSEYTKKALAFLVTHENLAGAQDELLVLNVQPPLPPRVAPMVGSDVVKDYHRDEADKVLDPIRQFLDRHLLRYRCEWVVGAPAAEIVAATHREKAHLIVMGTHGHGLLGRVLMGSVAQRVVADCDVPVLLVK